MAIRHITEDGRMLPARRADIPSSNDDLRNWAEALVTQARADGVQLTGADGLLTGLVKEVLQAGLEVEMADHLGYESRDPSGRGVGQQPQRALPQDGRHRDRRSDCAGSSGPQRHLRAGNGPEIHPTS